MAIIFIFVLGLCVGSFLAAYTWRMLHGVSIAKGRSFCPKCKHMIVWYDNIPLFSFLYLKGKCRNCKKPISSRYPVIEGATAISFSLVYLFYSKILINISWLSPFGLLGLIFILFLVTVSIAIIITDLEEMIIPDEFVFTALIVSFFVILFSPSPNIWQQILVSFSVGSFFLLLNLITKGHGMGLGDVKLALPFGLILGFPLALVWLFTSFITGAVVGLVLLYLGKAGRKTKIPFGPFMVVGAWLTLFLGSFLLKYFLPVLN